MMNAICVIVNDKKNKKGERMKKIKNFSIHPIRLGEDLEKEYEIVEPQIDKKELILDVEGVLEGKCTMADEQKRIIRIINSFIQPGDVVYVAGHPALVLSVTTVAQIKGATVVTGMIDKSKEVIKIEELITYSQLDRKFRLGLEYNLN